MSQINVNNLTFCYEGSSENVFENVSFKLDTDWRLGFIGRNGRGKTTFLRLLMGWLEYQGFIDAHTEFDYFPYPLSEEDYGKNTADVIFSMDPEYELWRVQREFDSLRLDDGVLYRPFGSLSKGEQTKVMLAVLFARENNFLLIDEPTSHLDIEARALVQERLKRRKGFILASHDRAFLDGCIDHVLSLNRCSITVEKGNFSSWWENKEKKDAFEEDENEKLKKQISKLKQAARQSRDWADKVESRKIGYDPVKDTERFINTRSYLGEKSRRMQQRRKNLERRQERAIDEKSSLLKDIEKTDSLRLCPLKHYKKVLVRAKELDIYYGDRRITSGLNFKVEQGKSLILSGQNGSGKTSVIKAVLNAAGFSESDLRTSGELETAPGLVISYVSQDTGELKGTLNGYIEKNRLDKSVFFALLAKLDFDRVQFTKPMEDFSEGQKKKVLLAASLCTPAHLYVWDEPLNFIDVFSRIQLEELINEYHPTLILVEHDRTFAARIGAEILRLPART